MVVFPLLMHPAEDSLFLRSLAILRSVGRWCTVTVTDAEGRRHSLDLVADSSYDAAHLFVAQAHSDRALMLPALSRATIFEVVSNGKLYRVRGEKLREWILNRRKEWTGPKSYLFNKRPLLD